MKGKGKPVCLHDDQCEQSPGRSNTPVFMITAAAALSCDISENVKLLSGLHTALVLQR